MSEQPYIVHLGGRVKSYENGRIGGRIVTFSGATDPDRQNEFFDGATDFWMSGNGERRPILYRHGIDKEVRRRRFGEALISKRADGLWCEGYLPGKDADSIKLHALVKAGQLNWSTGSVGHLAETTLVGTAHHIDQWPISEVSLCPHVSVAEPRNICSIKTFAQAEAPEFSELIIPEVDEAEHQREIEQRVLQARVHLAKLDWERIAGMNTLLE